MIKTVRIEVSDVRYKHASRIISRFSNKLTQNKFLDVAGAGSSDQQSYNATGTPSQETNPEYGLPANVVYFDPDTMTVDSVNSGATLEETLVREGDAFRPSVDIERYVNVWFDAIEAYFPDHWTLSGNYIVPNATLLSGTEVIGRYVVV